MGAEETNYWKRSLRTPWKRRRFLGAAAGLGAGAASLAVVGCGNDDDDDTPAPTPSNGSDDSQSDDAPATTEPNQGGSITFGGREEAVWPTSPYGRTALSTALWVNLHDTLIRYDSRDLEPSPRLAESWEFNGDESELVVTLRPGIQFWDGTEITPEEVAENVTAIGAEDTPNSQSRGIVAAYIDSAEAVDESHVRFQLARPGPLVFDALNFLPIIDTSTIQDAVDGRPWNGAGPFKIVDPRPQQGATLERHEGFWKSVGLDSIEYRMYADPSSLDLAVETGEVDLTYDLSADAALRFRDSGNFQFMADEMGQMFVIGMRVDGEVVDDPRIRRAMHMVIDRDRIVEDVFLGVGDPSYQLWPSSSLAYDPDATDDPFNIEEARQLVSDAGYPDGTPPIGVILRNTQTEALRYLEIIQSDAREAGLNIEITPVDNATFTDQFRAASYPSAYSTGYGFFDYYPDSKMVINYQVRIPNSTGFEAPEYLQLLDDLENAQAQDERLGLYQEFNDIWQEHRWLTPICTRHSMWVASENVAGLRQDPLTGMAVMEELSRA